MDEVIINNEAHTALAPVIISASRATDIPAFYAKQFMESLKKGYLFWTNPFNYKKTLILLKRVKLIVFWSKNPKPLLPYLDEVDKSGIDYYFNYTLNDYTKEGFERNLPALEKRIETFIELSKRVGKEKVIWRFDPVAIPSGQTIDFVIAKIGRIAAEIKSFTNKLVFSFVDTSYRKVQYKLKKENIQLLHFDANLKMQFVKALVEKLSEFDLKIATCAEEMDLSLFEIRSNKCIDNELIKEEFGANAQLMKFVEEIENKNKIKDKGQRKYCECIVSKDIGRYNTCGFSCVYCYAMFKNSPNKVADIFN